MMLLTSYLRLSNLAHILIAKNAYKINAKKMELFTVQHAVMKRKHF